MISKSTIILCCVALGITLFVNSYTNTAQQGSNRASELKKNYGVAVQEITDVEQLPAFNVFRIKNGEISVLLTPPTNAQYLNYMDILEKALRRYPTDLIAKNLVTIYIGGGYRQNGGVITGLYEKGKIYLFYNHQEGDNSEIFLEQTFHHEFSSILIHAYDFPAFDWLKLNPPGFDYIINPVKINEYMNSGKSYQASEVQLKQGLVSSYGKANPENDINSYVELIFTQPEKMQALVKTYPVIRLKYNMIREFYISISPKFNTVFSAIR